MLAVLTGLFLALAHGSALACAACYGDTSGSKMGNAASVGIFAMVVLMFAMLTTIFFVGWHLAWRAKHPLPDYNELMADEHGQPDLPEPGTSL